MKKNSLLALFLSMMFLKAVDDDGAGGDIDDDIGDFDLDDDESNKEENKQDNDENSQTETDDELQERLKTLEEVEEKRAQEDETKQAIYSLQEKYDDFDPSKIVKHLQGLDEEAQEKLNNPLGWELIYLENFKTTEREPEFFDSGRGVSDKDFSFDDAFKKVKAGDDSRTAVAELLRNSK